MPAARESSITRARVMPGKIGELPKSQLALADEVFVCSSIRELVPVVEIDGHPVGSGSPGPITRELLRAYRATAAAR